MDTYDDPVISRVTSRRHFLKMSLLLAGGAAAMSLLPGCGGDTAQKVIEGGTSGAIAGLLVDGPTGAVVGAAAGVVEVTVADLLEEFAAKIGARVIAETVGKFLSGEAQKAIEQANDANNKMKTAGYDQYKTQVYQYAIPGAVIIFYCASPATGYTGCAPFIRFDGKALVEGPVITGLAAASQFWNDSDVPAGDGLVITKALQATSSDFLKTPSKPFSFQTAAGSLQIGYRAKYPIEKQGSIHVLATKDNGKVLHEGSYTVTWP